MHQDWDKERKGEEEEGRVFNSSGNSEELNTGICNKHKPVGGSYPYPHSNDLIAFSQASLDARITDVVERLH
jgi:hypothetical protein